MLVLSQPDKIYGNPIYKSVTVVSMCSTAQSVQILVLTYLLAIHEMNQHLVNKN